MKELYARAILLLVDILAIALSILIGYFLRTIIDHSFTNTFNHALSIYLAFPLLYITTIAMLAYEGIYTRRYDFWHESRQVIKALIFSFIFIMAFLAMTQAIYGYSRIVIVFSFISMVFLIPTFKYFIKRALYKIGWWQRRAYVHGKDKYFKEEIFSNPHLGYTQSHREDAQTIFIDSYKEDIDTLKNLIEKEMQQNHEIVFIPLINEYDLTRSFIYNLSSRRRNLIVYTNRLKSKYRIWTKKISDLVMTIVSLPFIIPIMLYIAYKIKRNEPAQKVLFKQKRLGKNGQIFSCYKFQTMHEDNEQLLQVYLKSNPGERVYYQTYHKYKNDPRITDIGHFLRRTSLDELPQIFNVFRGDMSFIGPRPYMLDEKDLLRENIDTILTVKPGITGLWQVSGRNEVNFRKRIALDIWYIRNWNLWMDLVILLKTIKTVFTREGAQ